MSPIEIIEQLGFKKDESVCENYIRFKNNSDEQVIFDRFITFDLQRKTLTIEDELGCSFPLELPLLKAITQFQEELLCLDKQDKGRDEPK